MVSILLLNTYWLNHPTIYSPQVLVLPSRSYELLFVLGGHDLKEGKNKNNKELYAVVLEEKNGENCIIYIMKRKQKEDLRPKFPPENSYEFQIVMSN